jgi:streptogramin lyase
MTMRGLFGLRRVAGPAALLIGLSLVSVGVTAAPAVATAGATVTNFTNSNIGFAENIVAGPDGALWFTSGHFVADSKIGRIATTGTVTTFTDSPDLFGPNALVAGSDGALWFLNAGAQTVGRVTTGGAFSYFEDPNLEDTESGLAAAGSDGAIWYTITGNSSIGRMTTAGTVTNFTDPLLSNPYGIAAGPDGAMWFANRSSNSIGRITTSGAVTTFTHAGISNPSRITAGPDGALWFTNDFGSIGRITTTGTITIYPAGGPANLNGIAAGPDGAVWFTSSGNGTTPSVGRITSTGNVNKYTDDKIVGPNAITTGPDGVVWFTNGPDSIAKITVTQVLGPGFAKIAEGNSGTVDLDIPISLSLPSTQTVTAHWKTLFAANGPGDQADPATDYTPASGTVTFAPGQVAQTVTISVNGDTLEEPDEYFVVAFDNPTNVVIGGFYGLGFGIITDDDRATVVPGGTSVVEGDSGTTSLGVPVTLSHASTPTVTVQWATRVFSGNPQCQADPATDYTPASGTVTFAPGDTTESVHIDVHGDTIVEPNECIIVQFTSPTNAKLGGYYGLGVGGITNDD